MLRLKFIYIAVSFFLGFFYLILLFLGRLSYFNIFMAAIFLSPAGYMCSVKLVYILLGSSWIVAYPLLIILGRADMVKAFLAVFTFNLLTAAYMLYRIISETEDFAMDSEIKEKNAQKIANNEECQKTKRFENGIKFKELSLVNLYEITRQMGEHLKFEDAFRTLALFMSDNFKFKKCDLLIFGHNDDKLYIDHSYRVLSDDAGIVRNIKTAGIDKLVSIFSGRFHEIYLTREHDNSIIDNLGVHDDDFSSIAIVPLLSERKLDGLLIVEDLLKPDLERFVVLSMQFALAIKKIILYQTVERLAITDSLTGLYVRRYFYERFDEELQRCVKFNSSLAFIMLDIDDFKKCNDIYGHLVGDSILKDIAKIIKDSVRDIDIVARYGGEEFAIVLPEAGRDNAFLVADRLRLKISEHIFKAYDELLNVTVSMGLVISPDEGRTMNEIIERSDEALYSAKKLGKNVVCEYKK